MHIDELHSQALKMGRAITASANGHNQCHTGDSHHKNIRRVNPGRRVLEMHPNRVETYRSFMVLDQQCQRVPEMRPSRVDSQRILLLGIMHIL
jgi:hypothetical protein